jgi:hypothetical protein
MISMKELNPKGFPTTPAIKKNLDELLRRINIIREEWAQPMTVTSGLRSIDDHLRIYKEKAAKEKKTFDPKKVPMSSKHLSGEACDIADPKGLLMKWLKANPDILKEAGLWCEDATLGWVHFQLSPPKSSKRFFLP